MGAERALTRLADIQLPVKSAYQVAKLLRAVRVETQYGEEQRVKLIRELGVETKTPEGQQFTVTVENREDFARRMSELMKLAVEIQVVPLTLEMFGTVTVSASDLDALGSLLVDDNAVPVGR